MRKPWRRLLEIPWVYRAWQAPFAEQKLSVLWRHNDPAGVRRVLDVGCGPGTNAPHFRHAEYLGVDINPAYVAQARSRWNMDFQVADVTRWRPEDGGYDFILVNSLFHHLDDDATHGLLAHLPKLLAPGGHVHVLDLVLPQRISPARLLARMDRGDHPRPPDRWRDIFTRHFREEAFVPYDLGVPGIPLWKMVYFKGSAPT